MLRHSAELLKNRDFLAEVQRIGKIGSWERDIISGHLDWSDEVYEIFGVNREEFEHTFDAFMECVHPDDRKKLQGAIDTSMYDNNPFSIDYKIVLPDGKVRFLHGEGKDIANSEGNPVYRIGTVQDITRAKEAEEIIISLSKFPSENPRPVLRISKEGYIEYVNKAGGNLLKNGYILTGLSGKILLETLGTQVKTKRWRLALKKKCS